MLEDKTEAEQKPEGDRGVLSIHHNISVRANNAADSSSLKAIVVCTGVST